MNAHLRWPGRFDSTEIPIGAVIHACLDGVNTQVALCEKDGPKLPRQTTYVLDLAHPDASNFRDRVTCPGCLAWLHA